MKKKSLLTLLIASIALFATSAYSMILAALNPASYLIFFAVGVLNLNLYFMNDAPVYLSLFTLMDGNEVQEKTEAKASVSYNDDVNEQVDLGILTEAEAKEILIDLDKLEGKALAVNGKSLQGSTPAEIKQHLQAELNVGEITAIYLSSKMGVQAQ